MSPSLSRAEVLKELFGAFSVFEVVEGKSHPVIAAALRVEETAAGPTASQHAKFSYLYLLGEGRLQRATE